MSRRRRRIEDPTPVRHVLLYGTLCAREPAHARLRLRESLTFRGGRSVPGTLYDLGPYPGLVLGPRGSVRAELYRIEDPRVVSRLDRHEGYEPRDAAASVFVRRLVRVARHAGSASGSLDAWIYEFNGPVDGQPEIRGRSWTEHRRRRGAPPAPFAGSSRGRRR